MAFPRAALRATSGLAAAFACAVVVTGCASAAPGGAKPTPGNTATEPAPALDGDYVTDGGQYRYEVMTIDGATVSYAVLGCDDRPAVNTDDVRGELDARRRTITWSNPDGSEQTVGFSAAAGRIDLDGEAHEFYAAGSSGAQSILEAHAAECGDRAD